MSNVKRAGSGETSETRWPRRLVLAGLIAALLALSFWWWTRSPSAPPQPAQITLAELASQPEFARVLEPRPFNFPADHGPHPEYQTEWWYYTGNLDAVSGRRFAYQLTFFRRALAPGSAQETSALAARQFYFGHMALVDVAGGEHVEWQRISRAAAGVAGAQSDPYRVWLEQWSVESLNQEGSKVQLSARQGEHSLNLTLESLKPIVAHGDQGLSAKSEEPGNASYYVSYTRMQTEGEVEYAGEMYEVTGSSWFDHEWSTSALGPQEVGWDWFSLQLSDGRELMYYLLRRQDGSVAPASAGTLVGADGAAQTFSWREVELTELGHWTSPTSGARYPSGWRLQMPDLDLDLTVTPLLEDQEMNVNVVYWEGAVQVEGESQGQPISGRGFVELTGYAESIQGSF